MGTFSDLPRYPHASSDGPDGPSEAAGALRVAVTIARTAGEALVVVAPVFGCLWAVVALPVLLALVVTVAVRDEGRS